MHLLYVVKVSEHSVPQTLADEHQDGEALDKSYPAWISWKSKDYYLLKGFYDPTFMLSYSESKHWIQNDLITVGGNNLASYDQVGLGFRLAFRGIVQCQDQHWDIPFYIANSGYPFSEYEQLGHLIKTSLDLQRHRFKHLRVCYSSDINIYKASRKLGLPICLSRLAGSHPLLNMLPRMS